MKRQKKTLVALLCVLVVIGAVIAAVTLLNKTADPEGQEETTLFEIKKTSASDIVAFTLRDGEQSRTFKIADGKWVSADDPDFPLSKSFVDGVLSALSTVSAVRRIEEPDALSDYGLAEPEKTVEFTDGAGTRLTVNIGKYNSFNSFYYACFDDDTDVYMIDYSLVDLCKKKESDMIALDIMPGDMAEGKLASFTVGEMLFEPEAGADDVPLWDELKALSCKEYVDYHLTDEERAQYGLQQARIEYVTSVTSDTDYSSSAVTGTARNDIEMSFAMQDGKLLFTVEDSAVLYSASADDFPVLCDLLK